MFLSIENYNDNALRIRIREKFKDKDGKYHRKTISDLGYFPKNLELDSPAIRNLLHKIFRVASKSASKPEIILKDLTPEQTADIINKEVEEDEEDPQSYNLGILLVYNFIERFGLRPLFNELKKKTRRMYDLYDYFRYLISMQIIDPGSLRHYDDIQSIYTRFLDFPEFKLDHLYNFLDFIYENRIEIQRAFFETTIRLLGKQDVTIFYYDGTNFYFEISQADPDRLDELSDKVERGLRKFGLSKENRTAPIVSLGIIASENGIPLFFTVFPGNEQEITHIHDDLEQLEKALMQHQYEKRFLLCADAGNYSGKLIYQLAGENMQARSHLKPDNDAYIIGRGIGQVDKETREWMMDKNDYYRTFTSKERRRWEKGKPARATYIKSRVVEVPIDVPLENGRKTKKQVWQKQVAIFSEKRSYRQRKKIEEKEERAVRIAQSPYKLKKEIEKVSSRYLSPMSFDPKNGEYRDINAAAVDSVKIQEDKDRSGLFLITTSLYDWSDSKILSVYRNKNNSENIFKEIKSILKARPVYVSKPHHIVAHLDLCVMSCIVMNVALQTIEIETDHTLSAKAFQKILHRFSASSILNDTYSITGLDKKLKDVLKALGLSKPRRAETRENIRKIFERD